MTSYLIVTCKDAAMPEAGDKYAVVTPEAFDAHFARGEQLDAVTMRDTYGQASEAARELAAIEECDLCGEEFDPDAEGYVDHGDGPEHEHCHDEHCGGEE